MSGEVFGGLVALIIAAITFTGFVWYRSKRNEEISNEISKDFDRLQSDFKEITKDVIELKTDKKHDDDQKKKINEGICEISPIKGRIDTLERDVKEIKDFISDSNKMLYEIHSKVMGK